MQFDVAKMQRLSIANGYWHQGLGDPIPNMNVDVVFVVAPELR